MRRALVTASGFFALLLCRPAAVDACACVHPGFELLSPASGSAAPRNARVRVRLASDWGHRVRVLLRTAAGVMVATEARTIDSGGVVVIELWARGLLPAETRFEVIAVENGLATVVGAFRTDGSIDDRAPVWRGIRRGVLVRPRGHRASCRGRGPWAVLRGARAVDDRAGVLYAVWLADARGAIDTALPPAALVPMRGGRIFLGSPLPCDRLRLSFPNGRTVRAAVAAVDAAGNRTSPRTIALIAR